MRRKIAVIGAGVMGIDVTLTLIMNNYDVILKDLTDDILHNSKLRMKKSYKLLRMMGDKNISMPFDELISKIRFNTDYRGFEEVEMVIENITEDIEKKKKVYNELNQICASDTIYAVNTSCISITKIGALLKKPKNVIGVHFMNPVTINNMVEVIRSYHTSKDTEEYIISFIKSLNKNSTVVNDLPGFVSNRLSHLLMNEAAYIVQDQVAKPEQIDLIFKKGYGHKMGPLETADLIGLDTVLNSLDVLFNSYQDSKYRCCPLLRKMVDAGLLGKKSGKGFYEYSLA